MILFIYLYYVSDCAKHHFCINKNMVGRNCFVYLKMYLCGYYKIFKVGGNPNNLPPLFTLFFTLYNYSFSKF